MGHDLISYTINDYNPSSIVSDETNAIRDGSIITNNSSQNLYYYTNLFDTSFSFFGSEKKTNENPFSFFIQPIQNTNVIKERNTSIDDSDPQKNQYPTTPEIKDIEVFTKLADWDSLEQGEISQLEVFSKEIYEKKGPAYLLALANSVYIKNPQSTVKTCAILNVLSDYDYSELGEYLVTICTSMLATGNQMVWEYAANAISMWNSKDFIPCLEAISEKEEFSYLLKRIVKETIERINSRG